MGCFGQGLNEEERLRKETNKRIEKQLQKDKQAYKATHRLLLLGQLSISTMILSVNQAIKTLI